ncbi:MAG: RDD family protein [Gammaproteobacteria bacterium]
MTDTRCSPWRHAAAVLYDGILLFAVLFLATAMLLPFHDGEAIESGNILFFLYLLLCSYLYFAWQWVHGGQTLGMRAWHLKVIAVGDSPLTWHTASLRFVSSLLSWLLLGAGFLWRLFDRDGRTLHDRLSGTCLVSVRGKE